MASWTPPNVTLRTQVGAPARRRVRRASIFSRVLVALRLLALRGRLSAPLTHRRPTVAPVASHLRTSAGLHRARFLAGGTGGGAPASWSA